uniref:SET domain-containing protein n=1 Tax=Tetranychus urticae TaxID=32264 RepID=T1JVY8_TETUR
MLELSSLVESLMDSTNSNQNTECTFSDNIHPWLKQHMQLVHKYYTNEKFRENVTDGFLKLPNEIFMKSDERAERYRKSGNDYYKKDLFKQALREYNDAVAVASWESRAPEDMNSELALAFSNRSMCLIKLKRYSEALKDIDLALMHAQTELLKKKLNHRRSECINHLPKEEDEKVELKDEANITWKNGSTCLSSRQFNELDLVIRESPILSLLKKDFYFTRCFNCFAQFDMIMPCRGCNQRVFQSATTIGLSVSTSTGLSDHFCLSPRWRITAAHLLTYFTVIKRLPAKNESVPWRYDIELFGGLLLMFLRCVERDGRKITSTELLKPIDESEFRYLDDKVIGFAIYNRVKKLKHHCDPNVAIDIFNGQTITLRAIKKIEPGEPIKLDIGVNCRLSTVKERRAYLSQYGLECNCDACVNEIQPKSKAFLCPTCSGPVIIEDEVRCLECNGIDVLDRNEVLTELDSCLYNYRQANLALINRERNILKAEDYLLDCYRKLAKICYPTNHNLSDICDRLSYCYKKMRKYKLSLFYAQIAFNCLNEAHHIFQKSRINGFFNFIDRQRNFLIWCAKRDKVNEIEFHDMFIETKNLIAENLKEAQLLIETINFEKDYYCSITNSIKSSLSEYNLI